MRPRPFLLVSLVAAHVALVVAVLCTSCQTEQAPAGSPAPALAGARDPEWRQLFDGRSTAGWQQVGPGELTVENGELVTHGGMGLLWYTREKFSNCQVRVVFKLTATNDNSGVFIRIPEPPHDPWDAVNKGYEVQIDDTGDPWHRTGCLYSFSHAKSLVVANVNDWNTMVITLFGPHTRVHVNGVPVTDYMEGQPVPDKQQWYEGERGRRPDSGYIGLQNHGEDAHVHFKEVSVKRLSGPVANLERPANAPRPPATEPRR